MQTHNFDVDIHISSSNQKVTINRDFIQVNQSKINCDDVKAIRYGVSLIGNKKNPQRKDYTIEVLSKDDKTLNIKFSSSKVEELLEEDHTYYYIMSGLWQYVKKNLISQYIDLLNNQQIFEVGNATITHEGFAVTYKTWFFGKKKTGIVPWSDVKYYLDKGILHIDSLSSKKKKVRLSLHHDWNAVVLNTLMHYLWQDNRRQKLSRGEKI